MKKEEVEKIVSLRKYIIECYNSLDGRSSPGTSIIKQSQVAYEYEKIIGMIDNMIKEHVTFS
tara:strand:- start:189 stop:374 length:186 start_codon:yes stop_codon:yes gene_type:complete